MTVSSGLLLRPDTTPLSSTLTVSSLLVDDNWTSQVLEDGSGVRGWTVGDAYGVDIGTAQAVDVFIIGGVFSAAYGDVAEFDAIPVFGVYTSADNSTWVYDSAAQAQLIFTGTESYKFAVFLSSTATARYFKLVFTTAGSLLGSLSSGAGIISEIFTYGTAEEATFDALHVQFGVSSLEGNSTVFTLPVDFTSKEILVGAGSFVSVPFDSEGFSEGGVDFNINLPAFSASGALVVAAVSSVIHRPPGFAFGSHILDAVAVSPRMSGQGVVGVSGQSNFSVGKKSCVAVGYVGKSGHSSVDYIFANMFGLSNTILGHGSGALPVIVFTSTSSGTVVGTAADLLYSGGKV